MEPQAPTPSPPPPPEPSPPAHPDATAVNEQWRAEAPSAGGFLARLVSRWSRADRDAQRAFNASQVRLDNEILAYVDGRFEATHRHYDAVLGIHGRHMQEIDERHLILQEELVAHVHDLVKRIDLVLSAADRDARSLEAALRDLRGRIEALEKRSSRG